jgi:hypothetical protein
MRWAGTKISNLWKYIGTREPGSSLSIVIGYRLGDQCWILDRGWDLFFLYPLCPASSGVHPASCTTGTRGKVRPRHDADHSPPSSAKGKKERGDISSPPQAPFVACSR